MDQEKVVREPSSFITSISIQAYSQQENWSCNLSSRMAYTITSSPRNRHETRDCWYGELGRIDAPLGAGCCVLVQENPSSPTLSWRHTCIAYWVESLWQNKPFLNKYVVARSLRWPGAHLDRTAIVGSEQLFGELCKYSTQSRVWHSDLNMCWSPVQFCGHSRSRRKEPHWQGEFLLHAWG